MPSPCMILWCEKTILRARVISSPVNARGAEGDSYYYISRTQRFMVDGKLWGLRERRGLCWFYRPGNWSFNTCYITPVKGRRPKRTTVLGAYLNIFITLHKAETPNKKDVKLFLNYDPRYNLKFSYGFLSLRSIEYKVQEINIEFNLTIKIILNFFDFC